MPQIYRVPKDFQFGTLTTAITSSQTSITEAKFSTLPALASTDSYVPVVLMDTTTGLHEVVWVTVHTSGSTTVTVMRGREQSTAKAWSVGTVWSNAPTAWDAIADKNGVASPYVGQRVLNGSAGRIEEWTYGNGWQASAGAYLPTQAGPAADGAVMPSFAFSEMRVGTAQVVTAGDGFGTVNLPLAFPNKHAAGVLTSADENLFAGPLTWCQPTLSSFKFVGYHPGGSLATTTSIKLNFICWGW
ncbi:hypothetical protein N8J89_08135 [Crossiella sp. CA-258035]|uniref:hypothetical protein n=1 Tax=Crossiella sp. CA-258035 TaxID=2981138 RepID=UPI0024BD3588|nr:hypothetical protein [Crossiella sp. CA-258035]WHT21024.1 hypothetical protein N8J89_08135 [Crossiella sp. CA-258035]